MKKCILIFCALFLFSVSSTYAEENQNSPPFSSRSFIESMQIGMMETYANPKIADIQARYCRNLYEALQKYGFTKEQSIKIVISQCSLGNFPVQ